MKSPLVSILIPAYNAAEFIAPAIQSALDQTWSAREIIVVDDGSRDDTLAVARRFESAGVKVVSQPNQGVCVARNHAFGLSQGTVLQWLDADDVLAPDKIARQMEVFTAAGDPKVVLSSAFGCFYYGPSRAEFVPDHLWADLTPAEWLMRKMERKSWIAIQAWLVSRESTEAAGPWDVRILRDNDGEYFSRLISKCREIRFVPEARSFVRRGNPKSISSEYNLSPRKIESTFLAITMEISYLRALDDGPRARAACVKYLQRWLPYYYPERNDIVQEARNLAHVLGGELREPEIGWKYALVRDCLGWRAAKTAQTFLPQSRAWLSRCVEGWRVRWNL